MGCTSAERNSLAWAATASAAKIAMMLRVIRRTGLLLFGWNSGNSESASCRFGHAQHSASDQRAERLVGLADAFRERNPAVIPEIAAQRLVGQMHGKSQRLPRRSDRRRGRQLLEYPQPLLHRRVHAVHVEYGRARALARDGVNESARDFSCVEPRNAAGERHLVRLARRGGENREGRL